MSQILEREEGLFTRHGATRALCIVAALGFVPAAAFFILIFGVLILKPDESLTPLIWRLFISLFWMVAASSAVSGVLWSWRRCDRCRRRLFAEAKYEFLSHMRKPENRTWFNSWWVRGMIEPERHYKATKFLGSYRNGALMSMALRGRLRCQWCGHEDGVKPDYVVISPQ